MKCPNCKSTNVELQAQLPTQYDEIRFTEYQMHCKACGHYGEPSYSRAKAKEEWINTEKNRKE